MENSKDTKGKILVVEDDPLVGNDIKICLENLKYEVRGVVPSGEQAITACLENLPELVLMDIQLEGTMDGIQAAEILKEKYQLPIIYLTANSEAQTLKRAKITLPFGFVLKPFSERELESNIQMALYHHSISKQRDDLLKELQSALSDVQKLEGMLPICSYCKNIRNDSGYWESVEAYIAEHSNTQFTHGICPECLEKNFPELLR